ncbi:hypothetical protein E2P81_ATG09473 [Venturia nashicola]|nr:hypothetical protein E2P81_ATG09473 [Venturia nashicola]
MPSDKDRLYLALYARSGSSKMSGGEDKYHWSLMIGPKKETPDAKGRRCHATNMAQIVDGDFRSAWIFEDHQTSLLPTGSILVRVLIGKVADGTRLREVFARTPIRAGHEGYEGWNCISWVQEALSLAALDGKALGTCHTDWTHVRDTALWYVRKKAAEHRFDGKKDYDLSKIATWDAIEGTELIV